MSQEFKADGNKLKPSLIFDGMPDALQYLFAVATYGAEKYEPHGWKRVDVNRYIDAKWRHAVSSGNDDESGLPHLAHEIWGCLAILQSKIDSGDIEKFSCYNKPPIDHKQESKCFHGKLANALRITPETHLDDLDCDEDGVPYIVFAGAPDWANYAAKDSDEQCCVYDSIPKQYEAVWIGTRHRKTDFRITGDWKDSLRRIKR